MRTTARRSDRRSKAHGITLTKPPTTPGPARQLIDPPQAFVKRLETRGNGLDLHSALRRLRPQGTTSSEHTHILHCALRRLRPQGTTSSSHTHTHIHTHTHTTVRSSDE